MGYYGDGSNITGIVDTGSRDDIALLGFKVAANGSLAKYNLVDQAIDAFEDASGVDAGSSTDEVRNAAGNYYSGTSPASGGTETSYDDGGTDYAVHTFLSSGTFVAGATADADILVVAGGGYGSTGDPGGGGGAGGMLVGNIEVSAGSKTITVGAGGTSGVGDDSIFDVGGLDATADGGGNGGAGGGSGGGGASAASVLTYGGADGLSNSISGSAVYYAGGGGGGGSSGNPPGVIQEGGLGGGGAGQANVAGSVGTANTGGGGGSGNNSPGNGLAGGSGIVIISWGFVPVSYTNMTLVSTATTAQAVPTKGDMVMTYTNGAGTAVINTNIKGYVSRDGGTTYTQGTLASQGTTGGHTILSFHDLDISGQPSGSSMRYKIETLVQSISMQTRIQAVSLGWS